MSLFLLQTKVVMNVKTQLLAMKNSSCQATSAHETSRNSVLSSIMSLAWQFVKRNGYSITEALRVAWANYKLKLRMSNGIVRFYYRKVDGTIREAFGTLSDTIVHPTMGTDRKKNDTVQTYYDTECQEWRCFKVANLIKIGN